MNPDEFLQKAKNPTDNYRLPKVNRALEDIYDENSSQNSNMPKVTKIVDGRPVSVEWIKHIKANSPDEHVMAKQDTLTAGQIASSQSMLELTGRLGLHSSCQCRLSQTSFEA